MPEPVRQLKRAPKSAFRYRLRLWAGWIIYTIGWGVWVISLWLPAGYLSQGAWTHPNKPLPTVIFVIATALIPIFAFFNIHLYWSYLPLWLYYPGLLAAVLAAFRPGSAKLLITLRLSSLALLESCLLEATHLFGGQQDTFYYGADILALGSTLICLGVWLIPPRRKHNDIVALGPTSEPQAGAASGNGIGGG